MAATTQHDLIETRSAELQQQWHGFGSPVGLGLGLVSLGLFTLLVSLAAHLFR